MHRAPLEPYLIPSSQVALTAYCFAWLRTPNCFKCIPLNAPSAFGWISANKCMGARVLCRRNIKRAARILEITANVNCKYLFLLLLQFYEDGIERERGSRKRNNSQNMKQKRGNNKKKKHRKIRQNVNGLWYMCLPGCRLRSPLLIVCATKQ